MDFLDWSSTRQLYWQDMIFRHKHAVQLATVRELIQPLDEPQPRNDTYARTHARTHATMGLGASAALGRQGHNAHQVQG
jgi:hypothetical protein